MQVKFVEISQGQTPQSTPTRRGFAPLTKLSITKLSKIGLRLLDCPLPEHKITSNFETSTKKASKLIPFDLRLLYFHNLNQLKNANQNPSPL